MSTLQPDIPTIADSGGGSRFKSIIRPLTKVLNPVILKLAGRRHFSMVGQIHHVGRRSGRSYVTPGMTRQTPDAILIPLTFGTNADWARNIQAAGRSTIRLNGQDHTGTNPEILDAGDATVRSAYHLPERVLFRAIGINQFMRLTL